MGGSDAPRRTRLLIQIDGLSKPVLDRAIAARVTPAIARLTADHETDFISVYSGLPSTTPAAQGELFYGVRCAVPAFAFLEGRTIARQMVDPSSADAVQKRLEQDNEGLLAGGSSYCNIYTGGAEISRFCPAGMGRPMQAISLGPIHDAVSLASYIGAFTRSTIMLVHDLCRQYLRGKWGQSGAPFWPRVKDSWDRISVSIVLRDSSRIAGERDLRRGLPVVHINFLGYDKQAHRYGPDSAPALSALRGIDRAIAALVRTLREVDGKDARAVIYSDHGQERATSVGVHNHEAINAVVHDAMKDVLPPPPESEIAPPKRKLRRSLIEMLGESVLGVGATHQVDPQGRPLTVVESGPLAHVYLADGTDHKSRIDIARGIAARLDGLVALVPHDDGSVAACRGTAEPMTIAELCDAHLLDHPFAESIRVDLVRLALHPDAGDIILIGTGFAERQLNFGDERGSHAGPGRVETHAFAIVPRRFNLRRGPGEPPVRFCDLRGALLAERAAHEDSQEHPQESTPAKARQA